MALVSLMPVTAALAAAITWDGGGGDFSWQNPANWSGDVLPASIDDVIINTGGGITITSSASVTIRSLQCSNNLALTGGSFQVNNVDSVVQGQVLVTGNPIFSASGAMTTCSFANATNLDGLGLEARAGATVSAPALSSYNKGSGCASVIWQASDPDSVVALPALTNLTGADCATFVVQALSGGTVALAGLTTVSEGAMSFLSDGAGSLLELPALQQSLGTQRIISFEARNNGTVSMPQFSGGTNVTVILKPNASLSYEQLRELSGFTASATQVDLPGLTNLTSGSITVESNAVVTATNLVSYRAFPTCSAPVWRVTGPGSVLSFAQLTNMTGPVCGFVTLRADAGGRLFLTNLAAIAEGTLNFSAEGTNSLISLTALHHCDAALRAVSFNVSNDGAIVMPLFQGGPEIVVSLASGGHLPAAQLRELLGFTVSGMAVDFAALTNLTSGNVTVNSGGTVTTPSLVSHSQITGCSGNTWLVTGAGSVLDLSALTTLAGAGCGTHNLHAKAGGTMDLRNLPLVSDGTLTFLADGGNSVMNLSSLAQTAGARTITFSAANHGAILAPVFAGNTNVVASLQFDGAFPAAQMRRLYGFSVNGMAVEFTALTNLSTGGITVSGGGTATAPSLTRHSEFAGCAGNSWVAIGAGSVLEFANLTNLTGAGCGVMNINGTAGGHVLFGALATLGEGAVGFLADGTNSLIDLSSLTQSLSTNHSVWLTAQRGGVILVPVLQGGETLAVTIKSGGSLGTSELKLLKSLTVSGTSLELPGITNLFAGDLVVDQGAVLRLPGLYSHSQDSGCQVGTWSVSGTDSVLDLTAMTNITGSSCGFLNINALAGGRMNLSNLLTISDGIINFAADGAGSLIDLGTLENALATSRTVSFEARNAGNITMPRMSGGASVAVTIKTNGLLSIAQLRRLRSITVMGTNASFDALTNLDGGSLSAVSGGLIAAPALANYEKGTDCTPATWLSRGAGSVLTLPALAQLTGGDCVPLTMVATNGGQILLGSLGRIPGGTVVAAVAGSGSVLDLHALSNFLSAPNLSRLTATNGGSILFNDQPLFLSGVSANLVGSAPTLPQLNLAGTNLILHGNAWRSYWTEIRDTTSATNLWEFLQRVPLTNDFQVIAPRAVADREFRGWEFVADPFALELVSHPGVDVQPVLYGPVNHGFEVLRTADLVPPVTWEPLATVSMTNTFRILPSESVTNPRRFFKVNEL